MQCDDTCFVNCESHVVVLNGELGLYKKKRQQCMAELMEK